MFTVYSKKFNQLSEDEQILIKTHIVNNKQFLTNKQKSILLSQSHSILENLHSIIFISKNKTIIGHLIPIKKMFCNLCIYSEHSTELYNFICSKYKILYFSFDSINETIISNLLQHYYNTPYILYNSHTPEPLLKLTINKYLRPTELTSVYYLLQQYNIEHSTPCEAYCSFNRDTLDYLYKSINDDTSNEISGKLLINHSYQLDNKIIFEVILEETDIKKGESIEADTITSRYNFHTHPVKAYTHYNCELGWPSKDDYIIFIMSFLHKKSPTMFHWVCTKEGIYVLTIPKESINPLSSLKKENKSTLDSIFEKYVSTCLEVDKLNFKKSTGTTKYRAGKTSSIFNEHQYIDFIHNAELFKYKDISCKLIEIQFYSWNDKDIGLLSNTNTTDSQLLFKFNYPKIKGNCIIKEQELYKN